MTKKRKRKVYRIPRASAPTSTMSGDELRRQIERLGLTHYRMAEVLQVSKRQLQRWLAAPRVPSRVAMLLRMKKKAGASVSDLERAAL